MDEPRLQQENRDFAGTGGRSQANRGLGFRPAFLDCSTMAIHLSRFADGSLAPLHVLDGLPDDVVIDRLPSGRVAQAKSTLVAGFERGGYFYTRSAAARAVVEWSAPVA